MAWSQLQRQYRKTTVLELDHAQLLRQRLLNWLRAALLMAGLAVLFGLIGWMIGGWTGVWWALALVLIPVLLGPEIPAHLIMTRFGARPLPQRTAPALYAITAELYRRAGIKGQPELWYIPSPELNAFAVGTRRNGAIAISAGLLHALSLRTLTGVLAHEISHLRNNDTWVMSLATLITELTGVLAFIGQAMLLAMLPWVLSGDINLPWVALMLLMILPTISTLLQLALSRNRELTADLEAVNLTGDPQGLAEALSTLQAANGTWQEWRFPSSRRSSVYIPRWLRTHPETGDRIRRLLQLAPGHRSPPIPVVQLPGRRAHDVLGSVPFAINPNRRTGT